MKPNPFGEPWEEVVPNLKEAANILLNLFHALKMSLIPGNVDLPFIDLLADTIGDGEVQQLFDSGFLAQKIIEYVNEVLLFYTDTTEYTDMRSVKTNSENSRLGRYIKTWCLPISNLSDGDESFSFENDVLNNDVPREATLVLRSLKYEDFLKTRYWMAISKRLRDGAKCEICGSTENLHVHHKTYEHHGYEHLYLEDLQCLCNDCHLKVHHELNKKK